MMNINEAVDLATGHGVQVGDSTKNKRYESIKVSRGNDTLTVMKSRNGRGAVWGIYGSLVPRSSREYSEFEGLTAGVAIERAVKILVGLY